VLDLALVRAPDVETVAARHHQVVDSHQLLPDARSRPLTTHTVQRWASACTVSRMLSQITPSLGRLTIGVNTPS
jgi:hypothetical protein